MDKPNTPGTSKPSHLEAKRQQKKQAVAEKKPSKAELYRTICDAMDGKRWSRLPDFPVKYMVVVLDDGQREVIEVDGDEVCRYIHKDSIISTILRYTNTELGDFPGYPDFDYDQCVKCYKYWLANAPAIEKPKLVRWRNDPGLCFSRLPWDYLPEQTKRYDVTPRFDELLSRCTNAQALAAWIGSLFIEGSDLQQYVWIYGEGQNGKGALARFLHRALGGGYASLQVPQNQDKHWTAKLLGKRLGVFPDCNNYGFIKSGLFKSLTGGDPVDIERKFKDALTMKLNCKYMFNSNEKPKISSSTADLRRAIYCEIEPIPGEQDPFYEQKLWQEGGHFLMECIAIYKQLCPNHGVIPVDESLARELADENEAEYQAIFDKLFILQEGSHIAAEDFQNCLKSEIYERKERTSFTSWLLNTKKYAVYKNPTSNANYRHYYGIRQNKVLSTY